MARHRSTQDPGPSADVQLQQWDGADWHAEEQDEAAGHRARRLLSRSNSGFYGFTDRLGSWLRWLAGERWFWRLTIVLASLLVIFAGCFGGLWWRLGAGPINLDIATPWLAAAIEENIGHGNTVEVGGTQIERAGRIRIAVRIRDIIVRDRDRAIVASAPKAEVRLSGSALLLGRLRAESLNLVDAELAVRITPDGYVTVSAGDNAKPLATGVASKKDAGLPPTFPRQAVPNTAPASPRPNQPAAPPPAAAETTQAGLLAGLDWLDSLSLTGLDGQNLNEIGLKNGRLIVDDQQRGNKWNFQNISLSLRRPSSGGIALSLAEDGAQGWSLRVSVGPLANGVRSVDIKADKVSTSNILLAMRLKNLNYNANLPLSGELKGELGRDGLPTYFRGKITAGAGEIVDSDTPEFPMAIDSAEFSLDWDAHKRVLVAPFRIISGQNRITLLATLEPPNGNVTDWQLGFSGGTVLLAGNEDGEPPVIFNRVSIGVRIDTDKKRVILAQADFSNGEIGVAGTGSIDYAGEPRMTLGFAGTPMSASALKRIWPSLVVADVRQWVVDRVERGAVQRIEVGVNSPVRNLSRKGPPIPEDGLNVTIVANGVTLRPVDGLPSIHDADLKAHINGRTANVSIGQGAADTPAGRRLNVSDAVFDVPDTFPKPVQAKVRFKIDGPVPAVAELLASDKLSDLSATLVDPNASKGTASAIVNLALPIKREVTRADVNYTVSADLGGFAADRLMMNQKVEANSLKIVASNQGYQVKGDVKINGQPASLDYRKPNEGDADIKLQATLDEASRARFGFDLGPAVSGSIPVKLSGKIGGENTRLGIDADLTQLKLDNCLPGWVKAPGKSTRATFSVVQKLQSTRLEDIVVEGGGVSIKGSLEVDQNGDLINASFPTYAPSEGDKTSLRAERGPDGILKVTMRGDVFDGRSFLKTAISGKDTDPKSRTKGIDLDVDVKLGAVAGYGGESLRSVDVKMSRRSGTVKSFTFSGKLGRETPVTADLRGRGQGPGRDVILLETNDAGALLRFTDMYSKVGGGQLQLAIDTPSSDPGPKEGLLNVRDFTVKGEASLDKLVSGGQPGARNGIAFSRLRAEFSRQNGQLTIREGVLKGPSMGGTIEGNIDYPGNQVRMSGTFVPVYGLNNLLNQIPAVGLLFGGSDEGVFGLTYEIVGTPDKPTLNVNPISAILPGVTRKIMDFNTGRQNGGAEFPAN